MYYDPDKVRDMMTIINKDKSLDCKIENSLLSITIGTSTLCNAIKMSQHWDDSFQIKDEIGFAADILAEIQSDKFVDGVLIENMFDNAAFRVVATSEHIEEVKESIQK